MAVSIAAAARASILVLRQTHYTQAGTVFQGNHLSWQLNCPSRGHAFVAAPFRIQQRISSNFSVLNCKRTEEDADDDEALSKEMLEKEAAQVAEQYARSLAEELRQEDEGETSGGRRKKRGRKGNWEEESELDVPDHLLPKVAIVGRPNVGKSALFNRLAGGDVAIVHDEPGVPRDRLYTRAFWGAHEFLLVDTGGVLTVPSSPSMGSDALAITGGGGSDAVTQALTEAAAAGLPSLIEKQAADAVEDASSVIFVVYGQAGPTARY